MLIGRAFGKTVLTNVGSLPRGALTRLSFAAIELKSRCVTARPRAELMSPSILRNFASDSMILHTISPQGTGYNELTDFRKSASNTRALPILTHQQRPYVPGVWTYLFWAT